MTPNFRFADLGKLDCAELKSSARKDFDHNISNLRMLCSAEPTRLLDANLTELRSHLAQPYQMMSNEPPPPPLPHTQPYFSVC